MNEGLAFELLGLETNGVPEADTVMEALQAKTFEVKNFGLSTPIIGQLYLNRVRQLLRLETAGQLAMPGSSKLPSSELPPNLPALQEVQKMVTALLDEGASLNRALGMAPVPFPAGFLEGMRYYEQLLSAARLLLATAQWPRAAAKAYLALVMLQNGYHHWFFRLFAPVMEGLPAAQQLLINKEVKVREQADSAALIAIARGADLPAEADAALTRSWLAETLDDADNQIACTILTECYRISQVLAMERKMLAQEV